LKGGSGDPEVKKWKYEKRKDRFILGTVDVILIKRTLHYILNK